MGGHLMEDRLVLGGNVEGDTMLWEMLGYPKTHEDSPHAKTFEIFFNSFLNLRYNFLDNFLQIFFLLRFFFRVVDPPWVFHQCVYFGLSGGNFQNFLWRGIAPVPHQQGEPGLLIADPEVRVIFWPKMAHLLETRILTGKPLI